MLSDIILEAIEKLNAQHYSIQSNDFMQLIPVAIITSFLDKGEFKAATISFYPWNDAIIGKRKIKREDFKEKDLCFSYDLKFSRGYILAEEKEPPFAKLELFSNRDLGNKDIKSLSIFATFLANFLEKKILEVIEKRIRVSEAKINFYFKPFTKNINETGLDVFWENDQIELNLSYETIIDRPGSLAEKVVKAIFHTLKPLSVVYCSCDLDTFTIEYKEQKRNYINRLLLTNNRHKIYSDLSTVLLSGKTATINNLFYENDSSKKFIVTPVHHKASVVGFFLVEYRDAYFLYISFIKDLLNYASNKFSLMASYLFQRRYNKLIVNPIFNSRETRIDENKAFVLMPFTEEWSNRIWIHYIKPTVKKTGMEAIRADDLYGVNIIEDIWKGILESRLIIADITNRNTNVFYELGIAHTLGKEVIILTQSTDDIPFDIKSHRCIVYTDNHDGYEKLKLELYSNIKHRLERK